MKKIIITICLLFGLISTSNAQVLISLLLGDKLNSDGLEFGLEGGFNWSTIGNMEGKKSLSKFNLGFYFDIKVKNQFSFYTGVLVKSTLGQDKLKSNDLDFLEARTYTEPGDYSQNLSYFIVPALGKYTLKNNFFVEAGPQFGLLHDAFIEYNSDVDDLEATIKEENIDKFNRFDVGLTGGAGFKFPKGLGIAVGVKYYYGFLDIYKDRTGTNNQSLFLKINIPIGKGQKSVVEEGQ